MKTYQVLALIAAVIITACTFEMVSSDNFLAQQTSSALPTAAAAAASSPSG